MAKTISTVTLSIPYSESGDNTFIASLPKESDIVGVHGYSLHVGREQYKVDILVIYDPDEQLFVKHAFKVVVANEDYDSIGRIISVGHGMTNHECVPIYLTYEGELQ